MKEISALKGAENLLDCPTTRVKCDQCGSNDHRTNIQLLPFACKDAAYDQCHKAQHNTGNDITSQNDEHGTHQPAIASIKSLKSSFETLLNISKPTYIRAGAVA